MLKLLSENDKELIIKLGKDSVLGTRIISYALTYGMNSCFTDFWADDYTLIARFDNTFTLVTSPDTDYDELREFIAFIGADNIVATEFAASKLGCSDYEVKTAFVYNSENTEIFDISDISEGRMREAYNLISESIPGSFGSDKDSYLGFVSDLTFRKNKGFARAKCILQNTEVVSTAITAAETLGSAIISAVTCRTDCRKLGYGKKIVLSMAELLKREGKCVYVIALNDSAKGFYKHIGFKEKENIAYITEKV